MSNPLLEPIHGVSLYDYAAISSKMAAGTVLKDLCKTFGIEQPVFEEASALWVSRMQEDSSFEVTTLFGKYFGEADQHPKLKGAKAEGNGQGQANLERLKTDRYFYEELNGARQAAYAYGLDGAQWIQDNFGVSLGDFQTAAMKWMPVTSNEEFQVMTKFADYRQQKEKEYASRFAKEQGGNVADDVEF